MTLTDDTVIAQVADVNLYNLIQPVKEKQFRKYGQHGNPDYERKMQALEAKAPQRRLENERAAREIVRLLLKDTKPFPVIGEGSLTRGVLIRGYSDDLIGITLQNLGKDGLLDFMFMPHSSNYWGFESEFLITPATLPNGEPDGTGNLSSRFIPNDPLREALETMLTPFSSERPRHVLS